MNIIGYMHGYVQKTASGPGGGKLMKKAPTEKERADFRRKAPKNRPAVKEPAPATAGLSTQAGNAILERQSQLRKALR